MRCSNYNYSISNSGVVMIKVYLLNISSDFNPERYFSHFPIREQKAKRFAKYEDTLRSYGAGVLLWNVLGLEDCDIEYGKNGKPFSKKSNLHFNISHSGEWVALAVGQNEIGVDIECHNIGNEKLAKRVFTPLEQSWLKENEQSAFEHLWTLKEAVMKQLGIGLSLGAQSFDVLAFLKNDFVCVDNNKLYAKTKFFDNYAISVCTTHPIPDFEIIVE